MDDDDVVAVTPITGMDVDTIFFVAPEERLLLLLVLLLLLLPPGTKGAAVACRIVDDACGAGVFDVVLLLCCAGSGGRLLPFTCVESDIFFREEWNMKKNQKTKNKKYSFLLLLFRGCCTNRVKKTNRPHKH